MNHCKDKQRHKWEKTYGTMELCSVCGLIKRWKTICSGRKDVRGAFGRCRISDRMFDMRIKPRSQRGES